MDTSILVNFQEFSQQRTKVRPCIKIKEYVTWLITSMFFVQSLHWSLLHCCCLMMISDSSYNRLFTYTKSSIFVKKSSISVKWHKVSKMPLLRPQNDCFGAQIFLCLREIWAKCFLQKTALDLVKYGLHSATYNLQSHIGGPHPVLYFTIQAAKKYS